MFKEVFGYLPCSETIWKYSSISWMAKVMKQSCGASIHKTQSPPSATQRVSISSAELHSSITQFSPILPPLSLLTQPTWDSLYVDA